MAAAAPGGQARREFADEHIADLSEAASNWILVSASEDGSFAVTNSRTGATTRYPPR